MSSAINYDDVVDQLVAAGILVHGKRGNDSLEVGRLKRCWVEGDGEKRGWYALHEVRLDGGDLAIVGAYGVWRGASNNKQQIELKRIPLSAEQKEAIRARIREDRKRAEASRKRENGRASARARAMWSKCQPTGLSEYLVEKQVGAHGVRFTSTGTLVVPMCDAAGTVHGLQFIGPEVRKRRKDRNKDFWPSGLSKRGHFHFIGTPGPVLLLAEGYATAASLHEATGFPVAVAFDAGNMLPVAEALHKRYPRARILACGDDDWLGKCPSCQKHTPTGAATCTHCGADTSALRNAGREAAEAAALAVGGAWVVPAFADRGTRKITDFNDLQLLETPITVSAQIEAKLSQLGWAADSLSAPSLRDGGAGDGENLKPSLTVDEANERYALVYGGRGTLFDFYEHELVPKPDVLDLLQDHGWKEWKTRHDRKVVRLREVGFDPAGTDTDIRCNLFAGWPTKAQEGDCTELLGLLEFLCSGENNAREIYHWVLCWLAYPIQNPGAKMKTALVFHGPQGTGKSRFFEAIMAIYGNYGRIVDQMAIEDKFNDWASKKLFLIADEVVARQELYHVKNKLKGFITGDWIRINPKNVAAHEERNHVNIVFLSNERQPLVLEKDDRRYTVIWTPQKLSREYYSGVSQEINAGGIAALHHHLATLPLGDFKPWTEPPMTTAKQDLIAFSLDSVERFLRDWENGETEYPFCPCGSMDLFSAYIRWCRSNGVQRPRESNQFLGHVAKLAGWSNQPRQTWETTNGGKSKMRRMVLPDQTTLAKARRTQEEGTTLTEWLTGCFFEFRQTLEDHP